MKRYTDLEQSKKLAEILPPESADMHIGNYVGKSGKVDGTNIHYYSKGESFGAPEIIVAWSLAALLSVLPEIDGNPFNIERVKAEDGYDGYYHIEYKPATKEQHDILMKAMADAGYTFDFEKKELKKIEQKPAWSEEQHEKESLSDIENRIINFAMQFHDNRMKPEAEWEDELKMLRDNIKIDPWSEEDENMLKMVIKSCEQCGNEYAYYWLKSLKDRVQSKK